MNMALSRSNHHHHHRVGAVSPGSSSSGVLDLSRMFPIHQQNSLYNVNNVFPDLSAYAIQAMNGHLTFLPPGFFSPTTGSNFPNHPDSRNKNVNCYNYENQDNESLEGNNDYLNNSSFDAPSPKKTKRNNSNNNNKESVTASTEDDDNDNDNDLDHCHYGDDGKQRQFSHDSSGSETSSVSHRNTNKRPIPSDQKDSKYFERRRRNNMAAKKSRDARKTREDQLCMRVAQLEKENSIFRAQVALLREEMGVLQLYLIQKNTGNFNPSGHIPHSPSSSPPPPTHHSSTLSPPSSSTSPNHLPSSLSLPTNLSMSQQRRSPRENCK